MKEKATFLGGPLAGEERMVEKEANWLYIPDYKATPISQFYDTIEHLDFTVARYRRVHGDDAVFVMEG